MSIAIAQIQRSAIRERPSERSGPIPGSNASERTPNFIASEPRWLFENRSRIVFHDENQFDSGTFRFAVLYDSVIPSARFIVHRRWSTRHDANIWCRHIRDTQFFTKRSFASRAILHLRRRYFKNRLNRSKHSFASCRIGGMHINFCRRSEFV